MSKHHRFERNVKTENSVDEENENFYSFLQVNDHDNSGNNRNEDKHEDEFKLLATPANLD